MLFMITITAKSSRTVYKDDGDYGSSYGKSTRVVHMGFISASSKEEAQKRADAMCKELESTRRTDEPPSFSAETYSGERSYRAEIAGDGDLIRVGEFDD